MSTSQSDIDPMDDDVPEADYVEEEEAEGGSPEELSKFDTNQFLLQVASDPEMQALIRAKREGKAVKIVEEATRKDTTPEPLTPIDETPEFEGVDEDFKKVVSLLDKRMSLKLDPVLRQVGALQDLADGFQKQNINDQITHVAKKYRDFEKFRPAMAELARGKGQGLGVEELYALAKLQAGELPLTEPSTHSERPTPTPRRKPESTKRTDVPRGRKGFQTILADALDKIER